MCGTIQQLLHQLTLAVTPSMPRCAQLSLQNPALTSTEGRRPSSSWLLWQSKRSGEETKQKCEGEEFKKAQPMTGTGGILQSTFTAFCVVSRNMMQLKTIVQCLLLACTQRNIKQLETLQAVRTVLLTLPSRMVSCTKGAQLFCMNLCTSCLGRANM